MDKSRKEFLFEMDFRGKLLRINILIEGKGKEQALCLHGFGSSGLGSFGRMLEHKCAGRQLVLIDWIGFGKSSKPMGRDDTFDVEYCSEWLNIFISSAIGKGILKNKFDVVAFSMSAAPFAKIYQRIEHHINRIILINPAGFDRWINWRFALIMANPLIRRKVFVRLMTQESLWNNFLNLKEKERNRVLAAAESGDLEIMARLVKAGLAPYGKVRDRYVLKEFEFIKKPVLLISSIKDNFFIDQQYLKFAKDRDNWKISIIDHPDHEITNASPKAVADEIEKFLSSKSAQV